MIYCGRIRFARIKQVDIKQVPGSASRAQRSLTTGIVNSPRDVTMGVARTTALASNTIFAFLSGEYLRLLGEIKNVML